jgi:hypothetical protein
MAEVYEKLGDEARAWEASKEAARKEEELQAVYIYGKGELDA